jgi:hypothetical protein
MPPTLSRTALSQYGSGRPGVATATRGRRGSSCRWAGLFEIGDNTLVVRNGETHPPNPPVPLTFDMWLKEFRKEPDFLFVKKR